MQQIPVYVISLARASERRQLITRHLDGLGFEYTMIDAVEGAKLSDEYMQTVNPNRNMSPGVLGCYLSHIQVYERIVADQTPVALILEDDTVVDSKVKALLEHGSESLDFDYCFLGSDDRGDEGDVFYDADSGIALGVGLDAYVLSSGPYCTNAYLVTLGGAKKRLDCAFPARTAIDHYHFLPYRPRFRAVIPLIAFLNEQHAAGSLSSGAWTLNQEWLHQYWWFYPLRDLLKLRRVRKGLSLKRGKFPHAGRWRPFASAFKVARRSIRARSGLHVKSG